MGFQILGIGTASPQNQMSQTEAVQFAANLLGTLPQKQLAILRRLYSRTKVNRRRSVLLDTTENDPSAQTFYPASRSCDDRGPSTAVRMQAYEDHAIRLAADASQEAIAAANLSPAEITHLVTVSCSGFFAPGIDVQLINQLGCSPTVARSHIGFMGCHGALNGLRIANALAAADPQANVLLCAAEVCSIHHQYGWEPNRILANALFADGAAAMVGRNSATCDSSDNTTTPWNVTGSGSYIIPDTTDLMSWRITDHGFEMHLSSQVPQVIRSELRSWLVDWLAQSGYQVGDIRSWAAHPGGPRILAATADGIGIGLEQLQASQDILARYGNMSSPTVLFVLQELMQNQVELPCVMIAFGPGLAVETALIEA